LASSINASTTAGVVTTADTSGVLNIQTAGTTALTVDTTTNVGIGTTSPAQTLHVKTSTSATPITLGVLSNATGLPALSFNGAYASTTMAGIYGNGATASSLYYEVPSGQSHFFGIADATKITINSSGNLKAIGTISVGDATPSTSGAGITFPATQSASTNANTLDDYEEGTWVVTFTASSSGTITLNTANNEMSYIKVGSQVTIFGRVLINSVSSPSGSIQINLPFAPETGLADQSDFYGLPIMTHDVDLSAGALTVFGESSGTNYIAVYQVIDNAAWTPLPASNLKGNGNEYFYITGSYRAA